MNLQTAKELSDLRIPQKKLEPKVRTALQVARRVFKLAASGGFPYKYQTPEGWAKKWLSSKEFVLMEIDINAAASPNKPKNPARVSHYMKCSAESLDPIVVDMNKRKVGKTRLGYIPEVIVLDGKHRKQSFLQKGKLTIMAWVGKKASKRIKPLKLIQASANGNGNGHLPVKLDMSPTRTTYELFAATTPGQGIPTVKQDTGVGGSRPVDHMHSDKAKKKMDAGGPGSGRHPGFAKVGYKDGPPLNRNGHSILTRAGFAHQGNHSDGPVSGYRHSSGATAYITKGGSWHGTDRNGNHREGSNLSGLQRYTSKSIKAEGRDCNACGARSSGSFEDTANASDSKIPPDASDASTSVDPSDQLKWNPKKANLQAPGTKPGYTDQFGSPNFQSPGAGVGPRVTNKGASNSEFSRSMKFAVQKKKGKRIPKMWDNAKNKWINAVAPPGKEDMVMKLKEKYGEDSAVPFKIAWSKHNEGKANAV